MSIDDVFAPRVARSRSNAVNAARGATDASGSKSRASRGCGGWRYRSAWWKEYIQNACPVS